MQMPNRGYTASLSYRYGFNGKENDNEVKGIGNEVDYGMRVYDPRLGKFLSKDPMAAKFPMLSIYQYASNSPIYAIDLDGLEMMNPRTAEAGLNYGESQLGMEALKGNRKAQEAFSSVLSARIKLGEIQLGMGSLGSFGMFGTTAAITNLSARATMLYTTYSVAIANIGAFTIELLNPDPNGTPGLELTQGDEVARGLKLLFKQASSPIVKPVEKFILNTSKLDYLFGKLEYQNLKGADLEAYANQMGRAVESLLHNQERASDLAKSFASWGIKDNKEGFETLVGLFSKGLQGKEISSKTNEFGTTVTRELSLIFTQGEKKGQAAGSLQISYFYKGGDMNATPQITTVIAKTASSP